MPEYQQAYEETLPEGVYDFVVVDAIEKQSQNGNPMIELQLMVNGPDGSKNGGIRIFDHLTFTPKSYWKIDGFRVLLAKPWFLARRFGSRAKTASTARGGCG